MPNKWIYQCLIFTGSGTEEVDIHADVADYSNRDHLKFYNKWDGGQTLVASFPYGTIAICMIMDSAKAEAEVGSPSKIMHNIKDL